MREKYYGEYSAASSKQYIEKIGKKAAAAAAECTTPSNKKIGSGRNSDGDDRRPVCRSLKTSASELAEFVQKTKQEQYVGRKIESFGEQVDRFRDEFGNVNRSIGRYWEYTRVASRSVERIEQRRLTKKWGGGGFDKLIEKYKSDKKELKSECYEKKREIFITKNQIRHCENRIERIKKQLGEITGQNARVSTSHRPLLEDMSEDEFIKWFNNELIRYMDANEAAARAARMRIMRLKDELIKNQKKRDELRKCYINLNSDYKKLLNRQGQLYQQLQEDIEKLKVGGQPRKKPADKTGYLNIR